MTMINELCNLVRQCASEIHYVQGDGHLAEVYEDALCHRLKEWGVEVYQQYPVYVVNEEGTAPRVLHADLFANRCLIVEIKSAGTLVEDHIADLLEVLKTTGIEHGLLINFGSFRFEIRKFVLSRDYSKPNQNLRRSLRSLHSLNGINEFVCRSFHEWDGQP